jgi:hypothetical protein
MGIRPEPTIFQPTKNNSSEPICGVQPPLHESADQAHKSKESGNEHYGRYQFSGRGVVVFVLSVCLHVDHLFLRDRQWAIEILQPNYSPMKVFLRFQLLR